MVPSSSRGSWRRGSARARGALCLLACALSAALGTGCSTDSCDDLETEIGLVCVPDAVAADGLSVLQVREACGSDCASGPSCTAVLVDGAVQLTLREHQCLSTGCASTACLEAVVPCTLPALPTGDYPILVRGGAPQLLRVRPGGARSCLLPSAPVAPRSW
jgi:hypothetical protein